MLVVAVVAVVLVVAVVAVRVTSGDRGGPFVEIPVGSAGEVAVARGAVWVVTDDGVLRIDAATGEVADEVDIDRSGGLAVGDDAVWVGAHSDGQRDSDVLVRLDPATLETVAEVPLPAGPEWGDVAAGPSGVWVATDPVPDVPGEPPRGARLVQIDAATNEVVAEVPIQGDTGSLAVGDDAAWVTTRGGSTAAVLQRIDAASGEVTTIDLGAEGNGSTDESITLGSVATGDGAAWVVRYHSPLQTGYEVVGQDVCRIEPEGQGIHCAELADDIETITVGEDAVWASTGRFDGPMLVRIDPDTLQVAAEIDLPTDQVLDVAAGEGAVWVTNRDTHDRWWPLNPVDNWSVLEVPT